MSQTDQQPPISPNPLKRLTEFGQSVYVDEIRRSWLSDGTLKTFIERDGLRGVTSNPAIFQKAIADSDDYDEAIVELTRQGRSVDEIYEQLVVEDIQNAADHFRAIYDASDGRYGYVSLEVSPKLAHDSAGTLAEARHLWARLGRPNAFIKVPGTTAGLAAIEQLIAEGINVNVTLLFGLGRYREVAESYLRGLERRAAAGEDISRVASVASFFLSRIDVLVDAQLAGRADDLKGQVAIASARLAYRIYQGLFGSDRFAALEAKGARTQRLLWASTSTKNASDPATKYVEPLIGPDTINTLPTVTLDAYREQGEPASRLSDGMVAARATLARLAEVGISLDEVTQRLEDEGVEKFVQPFESLLGTLSRAREKVTG